MRYEIKEYCPTFKSVRLMHQTDSIDEVNDYIGNKKKEHPENEYYFVDTWRDGCGNLR